MAIIATAQVDINETPVKLQKATDATNKTIQDTSKLTSDQFSSAMNGRVTQSQYDPTAVGDDGNTHVDGDMWVTVDTSGHATKMWIYNNNAWAEKTWSQETLSVKELSALSADLGEIQTGTLVGVNLYAKQLVLDLNSDTGSYDAGHNPKAWTGNALKEQSNDLTDGNLSGMGLNFGHGLLHIKGRRTDISEDRYDSTYIGPNDIKIREQAGIDIYSGVYSRVDITDGGITGSNSSFSSNTYEITKEGRGYFTTGLTSDGDLVFNGELNSGSGIKSGGRNVGYTNNGTIGVSSGSDIYFHAKTNDATLNIHAGDVVSHGHILSTSTLSSKRDIEDFSSTEALSEVNNMTIKRWRYKKDDNSQSHIGPIIDDINDLGSKEYSLDSDLISSINGETGLSQSNALSVALSAIQELSKRNDKLTLKVYQLEGKLNDVN